MLYDCLKSVLSRVFLWLFRCEVAGVENIPRQGGVIIAANHLSNWDPPIAASFIPRYVHFMAKQELFDVPVFGAIIRRLHAFPVRRGAADRTAIKSAIKLLTEGQCLGLFPEGTRSKNGELRKPEPGLALIAAKAQVPVVPTAVIGTNKIFSNGSFLPKVKIIYGEPLHIGDGTLDKALLQSFSEQVMLNIDNLIKNSNR